MSWLEADEFIERVKARCTEEKYKPVHECRVVGVSEAEITRLRALESKVREFCIVQSSDAASKMVCPPGYARECGYEALLCEPRDAEHCWLRYFGLEVNEDE